MLPLAVLALCATLIAAGALSPLAQAGATHKYTGLSFGPTGIGTGSFSEVVGVTVEQSMGDVLVYDGGEDGRIYKFNSAGEPVDFAATGTNFITGVGAGGGGTSEVAVDNSVGPAAGDIYAAHFGEVRIYSSTGAFLGELVGEGMCGVTVDPSGDVYVGSYPQTVTKYAPVMNPVTDGDEVASMSGLRSVCNVAADSEGNVYAADYYGGIMRYEAAQFGSSSASGTSIDPSGKTLAVDPSTKDLYVNSESQIEQFGPGGEPLGLSRNAGMSGSFGVGVQAGGARLYIPEAGRIDVFGGGETVPDVTVGSPELHATTAVLMGTVDPDGVPVTSCQFEYGTERGTFPNTAACSTNPGEGTSPVPVTAELKGLSKHTTYYYRLVAGNVNGTGDGAETSVTTLGPSVSEEGFSGVVSTSARVTASINAGGEPTNYVVEYGPTTAYGSTTVAASAGTATQPITVSTELNGLQPGTTYHFRFVATNRSATEAGPNATFATDAPSILGLPDGRGYEKVSPNNNADGNVYAAWPAPFATAGGWTELPYEASSNGNAVAYVGMPSEEGGSGFEGGASGNEYVARRRGDGKWQAENVTPPTDGFEAEPVYQGFSADLSHGFLTTNADTPLVPGAPGDGYRVPYVRDLEEGAYKPLLLSAPPHRSTESFGAYNVAHNKIGYEPIEPVFAGSSADLSHVLYIANDALTENAVDGGEEDNNLYDFHNGAVTLVNVLPNGTPEPNAVFGGPVLEPASERREDPDFSHVISEDGNRIFWTGRGANRNIYMREGATRTVQVDAAVGGGGQYWTATPDGSKVLFTKGGDLYDYEVDSGHTTDLAPAGEVQGIVGTSEDFSYIYFVADAVLAPGGKQGTCEESERRAECGLYVLHTGEPIRYIATLSSVDNQREFLTAFGVITGDWQGGLGDKEAEVTPDGREVLFSSVRSLTGYDNTYENSSHQNSKNEELFVYEFENAKLRCISCEPSGEPPAEYYFSAFLPVSHQSTHSRQLMSDDGGRVFFNSLDPLVPQDTNGLTDVYEWERDGVGSCTSSEGCIYLLTGGTGGEGAFLVDSSSSGNDVFFTTRAQLVSEDQNENIDVYDAHVGAMTLPAQPECAGTGCQGLPSAPPVFSTPSSVTYNGVGNFALAPKVATKSGKAKTRKKPKKKKHKKGKKSKEAKGSKKAKKSGKSGRRDGHWLRPRQSAASYGRSK
ncbi:MAG: fibronectin type III domain-containing protein [Solirubrobacteraceae bacterium]